MSKYLIPILAVVFITVAFILVVFNTSYERQPQTSLPISTERPPPAPAPEENGDDLSAAKANDSNSPEAIANNLEIPWALAWLPDQSLLVTERPGNLVKISPHREVIPIAGVTHVGEGGLLGLALHPDFSRNNYVYLYLTTGSRLNLTNQVERYRLIADQLQERTVIIDNIPGSRFHDGGRLTFGPDGYLYLSTGDAGNEQAAQDTNSLAGKILRLNDDGSSPPDNPFNNPVYSFGHRNAQGLAWDQAGNLWATEHGRSGIQSGFDEINLIKPGQNYGWPEIQGGETRAGMVTPLYHSGPDTTWAPAGVAILNGNLYFAGLRGEALYRVAMSRESLSGPVVPLFQHEFGRLRDVAVGPDGYLYLTTSNTDGRGTPKESDDKIIRLNPDHL